MPYGLLSIFSFILATHWFFFYHIARTTGHLLVIGANNMSTAFGVSDTYRLQTEDVMTKMREYFAKFYPLQFDWTMGLFRNTPGYLAIIFGILGIVFLILYLLSVKKKSGQVLEN